MNPYVKALHFFRDAYSVLYDHCPRMLAKSEWNLAGKSAYDSMEKVAKAVELLANVHVTKQHNVRLRYDVLEILPLVAWRLEDDPMKSVSLCATKEKSPDPHVAVYKIVHGTMTQLAARSVKSLTPVMLIRDGSTIRVLSEMETIVTVTDTSASFELDGRWVQIKIDGAQLDVLNKYLEPVSQGRNTTAYYAKLSTCGEATQICSDGKKLFGPVKRRVGHRIEDLYEM